MTSPCAITIGHYQFVSSFDPLVDLAGLLWFVHTDDSVIASGRVSAIDDRVGPYSFAQGTVNSRPTEDTTQYPGHTVWSFPASLNKRFLSYNDAALAGQLDTCPAHTMGVWIYLATNPADERSWCGHSNNLTSYSESIRITNNSPGFRTIEASAAGNSTYTWTTAVTGSWKLLTVRNDGNGSVDFLEGGTVLATDTATPRSPTGMDEVFLGENASHGGLFGDWYMGGMFCATGQLSDASLAALATWFASSFA